jgi:thiopurine S-methyltransferase
MHARFWHQKWEKGEIGFHESHPNPLLLAHYEQLNLEKGARIFLPLCGKTHDIGWLLQQGHSVVGAELSELAIQELFKQLEREPEIVSIGKLKSYSAERIEIFVGDIFELSAADLGPVNAIYDRAALVALPAEIRPKYAAHMIALTHAAPQWLITYEYDPLLKEGPPFSVSAAELEQFYGSRYCLQAVARVEHERGRIGQVLASETVWVLKKA